MSDAEQKECLSCKSLRGEESLSPGQTIYSGKFWQVEHAYPTSLRGWLVCVLKRHASALHELTKEEFIECAEIQHACAKIFRSMLECEKEYVACFAEGVGFNHIHFHIVARPKNLSEEARGPKVFTLLGKTAANPVPEKEIKDFCTMLKKEIGNFFIDKGM
ncbi:MAG: HIT family protein [Patescibacteria group bacterium]